LILIEEISKKSVANYTQWKQSRYKVVFEQFKRFRKRFKVLEISLFFGIMRLHNGFGFIVNYFCV